MHVLISCTALPQTSFFQADYCVDVTTISHLYSFLDISQEIVIFLHLLTIKSYSCQVGWAKGKL